MLIVQVYQLAKAEKNDCDDVDYQVSDRKMLVL